MLTALIDFSLKNRFLVIALVGLMALAGVQAALSIPIDAVPDITNNQVQVITTSPSNGAEDIERLITFPIE